MLSVGVQVTVAIITDCLRGSVIATRVGELRSASDDMVKLEILDRSAWSHCENSGSYWDPGVGGAACAAHREIVFGGRINSDSVGESGSIVGHVVCEVVGRTPAVRVAFCALA